MVVALALSFLHLNNPLHSVYALSNLGTSWLSREILFVSLFLFALVLVIFILHFRKPDVKYYRGFILGTAIIGVFMVYTMSRLYMIPTVPPWNSLSTLVGFYSTALLLGSAFVLGLSLHRFRQGTNRLETNRLKANHQGTNPEGTKHEGTKANSQINRVSKIRVLIFIVFLAVAFILVNGLFIDPGAPEAHVAFKSGPVHHSFTWARWGTILLGIISVFYLTWKKDRLRHMHLAFYLPFAFFLISELIARAVFYASYYRIGV
jgi:anaerobic dimethyl sulfoxide reductase subunit C (anchor subunit)